MSVFLLSQIFVSITLVLEAIAMQMKRKNLLLALLSLSCFFNGIHFWLLEQPTAAFIFWFSTLRFAVAIYWKSQWLAVISLAVSAFITAYTYIGLLSIIGFIGTVFMTTGSFSKNDLVLRSLMAVGSFTWLIHNALLGSPVGIALETMFVSSCLLGIYRHHYKQQGDATV